MALSQHLIEHLACPSCRGEVIGSVDDSWLVCPACRLRYPVRDGIPVMLVDEAEEANISGQVY